MSETIVREYFELHCFFVRQQRKYIPRGRPEEEEIDFFVLNPRYKPKNIPFVLASADLTGIGRAVVVVKGWHTETFGAAVLSGSPHIFRFVEPAVFGHAEQTFGNDGPLLKLLVVPTLPVGKDARNKSIEFLRSKGVDAVLPFRTILSDLIENIEVNRNYQKSDLLQVIRIFKNYDLFKDRQLELFRSKRKQRR